MVEILEVKMNQKCEDPRGCKYYEKVVLAEQEPARPPVCETCNDSGVLLTDIQTKPCDCQPKPDEAEEQPWTIYHVKNYPQMALRHIEQLEAENKQLRADSERHRIVKEEAQRQVEQLRADLEAKQAALVKYGRHTSWCRHDTANYCSCGLDDAKGKRGS